MLIDALRQVTPGGWGIWLIVIMLASYLAREWKDNRKLTADERQAKREGFTRQTEILMRENRELLTDLRQLRQEYDAHRKICYQETAQLREMLEEQMTEVQGLKRKVSGQALEIAQLKGAEL